MAPKKGKKDYPGFIKAAEDDRELSKRFFSKINNNAKAKELKEFFDKEGFTEISLEGSKQIRTVMKQLTKGGKRLRVGSNPPCPANTHY